MRRKSAIRGHIFHDDANWQLRLRCLAPLLWRAPEAGASVQVGDQITFADGPGSPGGIFHIDDLANGVGLDLTRFALS